MVNRYIIAYFLRRILKGTRTIFKLDYEFVGGGRRARHRLVLHFVAAFPDLAQAHSRVIPVED